MNYSGRNHEKRNDDITQTHYLLSQDGLMDFVFQFIKKTGYVGMLLSSYRDLIKTKMG